MPISKTKNQYAVYLSLEFVHKVKKTFRTLYLTLGYSPFDIGYDTPQQAENTATKVIKKVMEKFNNGVWGIYHFVEKDQDGISRTVELSPKDYQWWNYLITNTKLIEAKAISI
jgi:hypothetical protein